VTDPVPEVRWLEPGKHPWPVPVLDVRPVTLTMLSTTSDPQMAANAASFRGDDGLEFVGQEPPDNRSTPLTLRYRIDRVLADGVLFTPTAMEHKWALFHHQNRLLVVRSWQRRVYVAATTHQSEGFLDVEEARGVFTEDNETPELTQSILDFIIRSHALGDVHPAPLAADPGDGLEDAALWCFSMFGDRAYFATHHRWSPPSPDRPLRTFSLLHSAIAHGDDAAAQAQLDHGVPIDLRTEHGLTAMQCALATEGTQMLEWVLEHGLDIDARTDEGTVALMNAVQDADSERVQWLLDHGSDPNAADHRGFTSLHRAAEMGNDECVRLLLDFGASPDIAADGHTARSLAKERGHTGIVAMLEAGR